ncbi:MAG TPA: FIST N-terminal domain-containing protein [Polyangiaceae bacterium]|nr:FIST N-terminal domain-containing protein [Polyangiaceae bacterium]
MATVRLDAARTSEGDAARAAEELLSKLDASAPKLALLFASSERDQLALNRALRERLPRQCRLLGATTGGEIDNQGIHDGSVVLAALSGDFDVGLGLGRHLADDAVAAGARATLQACDELGVRAKDLNPKQAVGMVIDDGFRFKKEELLLGVLHDNPELTLVGGGANCKQADPNAQAALLHLDGEVVTDAVLLALFRTKAPWGALRSHWYVPTGELLRITKTDDTCTRALEIDGQPAAQRYAEILGVGIDELEFGKPNGFARRPTALKVGREHFIRAPWKPLDDGSILFANLLEEGTELELMQLGDPAGTTATFFEQELPRRVASPSAALLFHCTARDWYARGTGHIDALSRTFAKAPPAAGMNVFFEIYSGFQINTTLTVLAFGQNDE